MLKRKNRWNERRCKILYVISYGDLIPSWVFTEVEETPLQKQMINNLTFNFECDVRHHHDPSPIDWITTPQFTNLRQFLWSFLKNLNCLFLVLEMQNEKLNVLPTCYWYEQTVVIIFWTLILFAFYCSFCDVRYFPICQRLAGILHNLHCG